MKNNLPSGFYVLNFKLITWTMKSGMGKIENEIVKLKTKPPQIEIL